MDILEEYQASNPLSESVLLEDIDEYEIYKFYLGFYPELRTGYSSPLRKGDESPSFSLFTNLSGICEYRWKDSGLGQHGTILKLVRLLFNLKSDIEAIKKIRQDITHEDYGITTGKISLKERPKDKGNTIIKVKSKEWTEDALKWWFRYGITRSTLDYYNVTQIKWFQMNDTQIFPREELVFAYRELDMYQIYQPHNSEYKFRNNYSDKVCLGFSQLKYEQDTLIITKSKKDVMCLAQMGIEAVSPRSETTMIPQKYLTYFESRYSRIVTFFDNDILKQSNTGKLAANKYPYESIFIPDDCALKNIKDISDFVKMFSIFAGVNLTNKLLNGKEGIY